MQLKYLLSLTVILTVIATTQLNVEARRLKLRPLSAREVYRILKEAGREDAIPEGRVVTQGLAAMTGFALGITKGIGGSLLFDLATSNATSEFINNFNVTGLMSDFQGLNMTAFTQLFTKGGITTNSSSNGTLYLTQEICFQSRSLEAGEQARDARNDENDEYARQATPTGTAPTTGITGTPTAGAPPTTNTVPTATSSTATSPTSSIPVTNTATTTGTGTGTGTATATGTNTATGTGTNTDTGTNSNTVTDTVTDTGNGPSQTCIVIQKPKVRKRRSSHRKRY